jgi:hypothetical protein
LTYLDEYIPDANKPSNKNWLSRSYNTPWFLALSLHGKIADSLERKKSYMWKSNIIIHLLPMCGNNVACMASVFSFFGTGVHGLLYRSWLCMPWVLISAVHWPNPWHPDIILLNWSVLHVGLHVRVNWSAFHIYRNTFGLCPIDHRNSCKYTETVPNLPLAWQVI